MSEPETGADGPEAAASNPPASETRPRSVTIGAGTALAVGCIVVLIVLIVAALILVPRPR